MAEVLFRDGERISSRNNETVPVAGTGRGTLLTVPRDMTEVVRDDAERKDPVPSPSLKEIGYIGRARRVDTRDPLPRRSRRRRSACATTRS